MSKHKSKKTSHKKEQTHVIPTSKTARGRRPHTEQTPTNEPYQTSLLADADWESPAATMAADEAVSGKVSAVSSGNSKKSTKKQDASTEVPQKSTAAKEEVVIEGQPAPQSNRTKIDLKNQIESVKGMVQMGTAIVKSSFPKPFEIAEKVVENWKEDGDFSELPIEQPLLQFYLGLGLRKAKETEKELETKLETAGVLPVFRQQWQKAQKLFK